MPKTLEKETITVGRVSQFGVQVGQEWLGINTPLTPDNFKAGQVYTVLTSRGKATEKYPNGKKYVAQIVGEDIVKQAGPSLAQVGSIRTSETVSSVAGKVDYKTSETKDAYWDKKNDSMKIGGLGHDTAAIVAALITVHGFSQEQALTSFEEVLNGIIEIRNKLD